MSKTIQCTNCAASSLEFEEYEDHNSGLPENGLVIALNDIAYYGGFMDAKWGEIDENKVAYLCHDCSLLLMRTMSGLAQYFLPKRGGHPFEGGSNSPCCEYTWSFHTDEDGDMSVILGTTEGTWEKLPD